MEKLFVISYEYGYSGEIVVYLNGKFYCTCDSWEEYKAARKELLEQNLFALA